MAFLTEAANRGSISTGYEIDNSLKLERANSEYLSRTPSSNGNQQVFTFSSWVKFSHINSGLSEWSTLFSAGDYAANSPTFRIGHHTNNSLQVSFYTNSQYNGYYRTDGLHRDIAAWYHFVVAVDTTQGTNTDRVKIYVNGVLAPTTSVYSHVAQNHNSGVNTGISHRIGHGVNMQTYASEYLADTHFVDGQALAPTEFGEFEEDSGIWIPKRAAVTYGTNGFYLNYVTASDMGDDKSGNGNDWTENNIAAADQATDTPTNNFCTLNPIAYNTTYTATEGNTKWSKSDTTYGLASGTQYVGGGKWYWEIKATDFGTYSSCAFGILDAAKPTLGPSENGYEDPSLDASNPEILAMTGSPNGWVMNSSSTISNNGSTNSVDYTFNEGDILAFALDMDNGGYWMGNSRYSGVANGSFWIAPGGTSTSGSVATTDPSNGNYALVGNGGGTNNGTPNFNGGSITGGSLLTAGFTLVTPLLGVSHSNTTVTLEVNFGGFTSYAENGGYADANGHGNFAYAVPSGFYALCTKNLAEYGG